jgi:hypothetical protein
MNKISTIVGAAALLTVAGFASANTVTFTRGVTGTSGGEFIGSYSGEVTGNRISFCLELNETVNPNGSTVYNYTVASGDFGATGGGVNGAGPNGNDPLSAATAYVFQLWMNGTLDRTVANARAVQNTIWVLEQELLFNNLPGDRQAEVTTLLDMVTANTQYSIVPGADDFGTFAGDFGGIRVINITRNGNDFQSQLTLIPLPTASGMALAGLALLGSRRRR